MRDMKKKLNPRNSVSGHPPQLQYNTILIFKLLNLCIDAHFYPPAFILQELMPWDHSFLSGVVRAER